MYTLAANYLTQRRRDAEAPREKKGNEPKDGWWFIVIAALALSGIALGWNRGQLPVRDTTVVGTTADGLAVDLALYRDVIRDVRGGQSYYEAAGKRIPQYGFPIASPLNWRLPTYAWILSRLPNKCWIQAVLLLLAIGGMWLTFAAQRQRGNILQAGMTTFLMFGVMRWTFDGYAYLAQEVWGAVLIVISLAARSLAHVEADGRWKSRRATRLLVGLAVAAGITSLMFRELALPWCVAAAGMAAWKWRWGEAAAWATGIALFFAFFVWHVGQVNAQLAGTEVAASAGIAQWLRFGGLDFVLLTTRMNSLLFAAPGWLLWLYLLLALVGLSRGHDETSQTASLAALMYLLAFAIVGRPENFYWGLMPAPLLVWGLADGASLGFQASGFKSATRQLETYSLELGT